MTGGPSPQERAESAFDRFRRADPAREEPVDLAALRAAVDRRIEADDGAGEPGAGVAGAGGAPGEAADDGATRAGRSSSPRGWVVAAAVATMLAVGTGGYVAGSVSTGSPVMEPVRGGGDDSADVSVQQDADPAQEEAEVAPTDTPAQAEVAPTDTPAQAEAPPGDASAQGELAPLTTGPVQFTGGGLPTGTTQAEAWVLDPDTGAQESLGQYPVISAADAVERLGDPRFGAGPMLLAPGQQDVLESAPPISLEPGLELPWPVRQVRLVEADLVTAAYPVRGVTLLLPTWHLTDDQGQVWPVPAVAEQALDLGSP